jgi:carbamoyl-phosphate synthase small subunit
MDRKKAKLVLEDTSIFEGYSFGAEKAVSGEVVFNTGMVGYPESFTDPSYRGQILVLTYPLIGNYGVPKDVFDKDKLSMKFESKYMQIKGLVVVDYCERPSHWNASKCLDEWLKESRVPAIQGIDTRAITKKLRERGTMLGKIVFNKDIDFYDPNKVNLMDEVSIKEPIIYSRGHEKIVLVDCGCKNNILRNLLDRNLSVCVVPWNYDFLEENFDGVVISNGPGDPKMCGQTIENVRKVMKRKIPIFGVCLGNQILALAAGGNTYKLKYGHRGQNQPCGLHNSERAFITSQNHGFAVDRESLGREWEEWFVNLNDGTNEGIRHSTRPFMSVQFHPEATPGPFDTGFLFDDFLKLLK